MPVPIRPGNLEFQALTALSYDVYTLRNAGALPQRLVVRLRSHAEFQGAKYEIAVAAIIRRAGFRLESPEERDGRRDS